MQKYCVACHNDKVQEGELNLSGLEDPQTFHEKSDQVRRVLEMVNFGAMPPEDSVQPTDQERRFLANAIDRTLFAVTCDLRPKPGKVTARRLNRAEYSRSIRDLFGMTLHPAEGFPSDEVGAGFDNNGDVLSLSPMLMEKYLDAAERVAASVLIDPLTLPHLDLDISSDQLLVQGETRMGSFNGRFLDREAFVWSEFEVPLEGEYRIRISGGNSVSDLPPTRVDVYTSEGMLCGSGDLGYFGGGGDSETFEFTMKLPTGKTRLFVNPVNAASNAEDSEKEVSSGVVGATISADFARLGKLLVVEQSRQQAKPDRNIDFEKYPFMVRRIHVEGPREPPRDSLPTSQSRIVRRKAKFHGDQWHDVEPAATESLRPLMKRAFRQEMTDDDVKPYVALVKSATDRGESYYRGLQIAISAMLVSPRFLFRVESPPPDWPSEDDGSVRLTNQQLATRMSYFLWSSLPDESLLRDACDDRLDPDRIDWHVKRMLADSKSDALAEQFASQWLGLRNLTSHEADLSQYPSFTNSLRLSMAEETKRLFNHLLQENRPVGELLNSDFTFANEELARHYGIPDIKGDEFRMISLEGTPRRGLLSHASILTLTSNPTRTSPVKRGKWILETILGTPPPDPPAGVPELQESEAADSQASLREQMEVHRKDPSCASCHRVMDALGFGLEQYDAVGHFRSADPKTPIDASGELPGGRVFTGAEELCETLAQTERDAFARTAVEKLLTFALGRELAPNDRCVVDTIVERTADRDYRIQDLIVEVVRSRPFQYYDWPESEATQ